MQYVSTKFNLKTMILSTILNTIDYSVVDRKIVEKGVTNFVPKK